MTAEPPIFVECQCACGEFWRFDAGKEPDELPACPTCRPDILKIDGVRFVAGERGPAMAYVQCSGCGHPWATFTDELRKHEGQTIVWCSRCEGDQRGGQVTWGPIPNGESKMAKAKANGVPEGGVEIDSYEEKLLCVIPDEDIHKNGDALAEEIAARTITKEQRRAAMAKYKDRMTGHDEKIEELGESVRTKSERRNVLCKAYLIDRQNKVVLIRTDTGAVVEERPATPEDRQGEMFDAGKGGKAKGAKKSKGADEAAAPAE